jgi:hypothetical protein
VSDGLQRPALVRPHVARYGAYTLLLIDFALFLGAGLLGVFLIACLI